MVYRCLHNTAPLYLRDLWVPISSLEGRSHLRSTAAGDLRIPSAKTVTISRRGFSVAGPAAWNNLSTTLKDYTLTFTAFKKLLKTELFQVDVISCTAHLRRLFLKGALQISH